MSSKGGPCHAMHAVDLASRYSVTGFNSIQLNSKTAFRIGDNIRQGSLDGAINNDKLLGYSF